ncbi:MAG: hypothetical protein ACJ8J7_01450 [Sulfurifustaceae bacterium]
MRRALFPLLLLSLVLTLGAMLPATVRAGDTLGPNEQLFSDQYLTSSDGYFTLYYQADGNLVLYDGVGNARWATMTFSAPGAVTMQGDGNLVVTDASGNAVYASGTAGNPGAVATVTIEGVVDVHLTNPYRTIWYEPPVGPGGGGGPSCIQDGQVCGTTVGHCCEGFCVVLYGSSTGICQPYQ